MRLNIITRFQSGTRVSAETEKNKEITLLDIGSHDEVYRT
jgi:hypothetical protein